MKKWLLAAGLGLSMAASVQAADKIALVNMNSLFQQVAQKMGVSNTLENEFKGRASELQGMENDLQSRIQRLQSMKAGSERSKLEKDIVAQRQTFAQKAQSFEQDRARRSNEERGKVVTRIQTAVKSVASSQSIDLIIDSNAVAFNSSSIKDITADVLKQVN
ncbi:molecular chaperone Skp [Enterobacteriaceae bacterium ESL0689]|nr:molecular chaperone Skp [Enterobacteriaceae bacterium ESL0689]